MACKASQYFFTVLSLFNVQCTQCPMYTMYTMLSVHNAQCTQCSMYTLYTMYRTQMHLRRACVSTPADKMLSFSQSLNLYCTSTVCLSLLLLIFTAHPPRQECHCLRLDAFVSHAFFSDVFVSDIFVSHAFVSLHTMHFSLMYLSLMHLSLNL